MNITMYRGKRTPPDRMAAGAQVRVWVEEQRRVGLHRDGVPKGETTTRELAMRQDLRNHSPDGAEWGYGGSGPAQLALAILADALGDDEAALRLYQDFKWQFVSRWQEGGFAIAQDNVRLWALGRLEQKEIDHQVKELLERAEVGAEGGER